MKSRNYFWFAILVLMGVPAMAQISGPTNVDAGSTHTYTYNQSALVSPFWQVSGGTKVNETYNYANYSVTVQWGSGSSGSMALMDNGIPAATLNVTINPVLTAPTLSVNQITNSTFRASWTTVSGAAQYYLDVATNNTFTNFVSGYNSRPINGATEYIVSGLTDNTPYWCRVRAVSSTLALGPLSNVVNVGTATVAPVANQATGHTSTSFVASWSAPSGATSYQLEVALNTNFFNFESGYQLITTSSTSATVSGLSSATVYYYRVRAVNSYSSVSANSSPITALTQPAAPVLLAANPIAATSFTANWSPATGATSYLLYVGDTNTPFTPNVVNGSSVTLTSQSIGSLTANKTYYYYVRSVNASGASAGNSPISVLTLCVAPTPSSPTAITASSFTANWVATPGATSYQLDVSTDNFGTRVTGYDNLSVGGTSAVVTVPMNISYSYRVRAVNGSGPSANSLVITLDLDHNYIRNTTVLKAGYTTSAAVDAAPSADKIITHEFFDGLGRPTQTVVKGGSPSGLDVVQAMAYDQFGRDNVKYLPYTDATSGWYKENALKDPTTGVYTSGKQYQFYQTGGLLASDTKPSAETRFEPSPLNRVLEQGAPGVAWQPDGVDTYTSSDKTVKGAYQVVNAASVVRLWTYTYPTASNSERLGLVDGATFYPVNKVYRNRTKNEDGKEILEYKDDQGRTVLRRVQAVASPIETNDAHYAGTYYIYNDMGQLACVLPPEATTRLVSEYLSATPANKELFLKRWAFRYRYDERGRMIRKQLPGAGQIIMIYDDLDRLALTQDSVQRAKTPTKEWTFTKYDVFGRPVLTGRYDSNSSYSTLKSAIVTHYSAIPAGQPWAETYYGSAVGAVVLGYDNKCFPSDTVKAKYYTATYYDKHDTYLAPAGYTYTQHASPTLTDPETSTAQQTLAVTNTVRPLGQVTGMRVKNLGTGTWLRTVTYYDQKYRPVQVISDHQKGKIIASSILDFVGKVLYTRRIYVVNGVTTYVSENPHYDQFGRLLWTKHATNGPTEVMVSKNEYNEIGQPVDKKLHSTDGGTTFKQSVDYRYNIRGWLYKVNEADVSSIAAGDATADYFGMELGFQNILTGTTAKRKYSGDISAVQWSKGDGGTARRQAYTFAYDTLSRLTDANHFDYQRSSGMWAWAANSNGYGENLTYDLNGNIVTLLRNGFKGSSMDNLTYFYNGNQLNYVNDAADATLGFVNATGTGDYAYDGNGNLTKDLNKGITNTTTNGILYNYLNLPAEVKKGANEKVKYIYDATGRKLVQEVYNTSGVLVKTTDYIGEMVYENNVLKLIQHPEGRVLPDGANWEYQYFLKDHLGNVRITFTAKAQTATNYTTDFEAATNANFQNYTNTTFDLVDHTDAAGTVYQKVQWLNGGVNGRVGLAKSLAVMPGDQVSITAYAKYMNLGTTANPNAFITSLAAAFGVSSGSTGEALKIYNGLNSYATTVPGGDHYQDNEGAPKAFVTIIFFDKDYNLIDAAWDQVTTTGAQTSPTVKQPPHDTMSITAKAPEAGYAFVFVSNEHFNYVDVYFDDATVTHTPSQIVSTSDYFPFGLSYNSMERSGSLEQKYLYNGKELQDEMALNWYDYGARMYMPDIGRWGVIDPLAEKARRWTPYRYAFNNPLRFIDPDGMFEYSNGYTTQDSRYETGSVSHSGTFDNSKEANKINAALDARAAANADLRQNAVATMDAAIRQREGGSQVQQGKNDAQQQAPLTQEIVDKVFSKSFKEDMVTGGNSAINRNKVGPRTGLDAATRDGIIQTLRGSAEQVLFEEGGNRFLGVIEIMIFQMDPAIISPSNPKGEVPGTLESIYFSPTFTPGKPIFENPGRPANRPFGIINQDDTQWRVLYKFQETALN